MMKILTTILIANSMKNIRIAISGSKQNMNRKKIKIARRGDISIPHLLQNNANSFLLLPLPPIYESLQQHSAVDDQ